jgi:hypothetical protein
LVWMSGNEPVTLIWSKFSEFFISLKKWVI